MQLPDGQLERIANTLRGVQADCARADTGDSAGLPQLEKATDQLVEVMERLDADTGAGHPADSADVTEIGDYALRLADSVAACADRAHLPGARLTMAGLHIDIALWVERNKGVIDTLEPVVDAIALLANSTRDPHALEAFSAVIARIVAAVAPVIRADPEKLNPGRPWRVLLLNQSIVATRSHNTELMEQAFALLTSALPDEAGRFFSEGMQQMDALDYPEHVRKLMQRYHRKWTLGRSLH